MAREKTHGSMTDELFFGKPLAVWAKVSDEEWRKLFNAAEGSFPKMRKNHFHAKAAGNSSWEMIFLRELEKLASCLGEWKFVAERLDSGTSEWEGFIEKIYDATKGGKILYRWEELERFLPEEHRLIPEVTQKIREIKVSRGRLKA